MVSLPEIGAAIRRARKQRKLSAQALAALTGMHRNTLLAFETGRGNLELVRLLALCEALALELELVPRAVAALRRADAPEGAATELTERVGWLMDAGRHR
ncbi:helix-turn-helix transcriptional regulator [Herbaspirillum sp. YR522]|uniref:helix-turn-helix domain-containing protein n=1 Tax=Herbaspirillum sp. YR522 TaxID=1144342 RepID=UPI00026F882E|nr:helix-turn-helix transcriptional regulator [Herbaspirillum sp. YR522]EJN06917.1 Helix-turn-helix protein [Herbaspirillum sp. YR522]